MNKLLIIILLLFPAILLKSQVIIGGETLSSASVSLEFGTENRGLVLPWVTSAANVTEAVDGTLIYDTNDKKIKLLANGSWIDLSVDETGYVETLLQDTIEEKPEAGMLIGNNAESDTTSGVLVLTDKDKAMILPKVPSPHLNIINPAAGMIAYDTDSHQLAVFNGTVWSFWEP